MTLKEFLKEYEVEVPQYDTYFHANAFDHPQIPIMTSEEPRKIKTYMWGLAPMWAKDRTEAQSWAKQILNATCEKSMTTYKPYFKT